MKPDIHAENGPFTDEYKIAVMQAFLRGEPLQTRSVSTSTPWVSTGGASWNWWANQYRIALPPKPVLTKIEDIKLGYWMRKPGYELTSLVTSVLAGSNAIVYFAHTGLNLRAMAESKYEYSPDQGKTWVPIVA